MVKGITTAEIMNDEILAELKKLNKHWKHYWYSIFIPMVGFALVSMALAGLAMLR